MDPAEGGEVDDRLVLHVREAVFGDGKIRILEYNNLGDLFSDHY